MAPITPELQTVQENIKNVIQDLFQILVQVSNYDAFGRSTRDTLAQDFQTLSETLAHLHATTTTTTPAADPLSSASSDPAAKATLSPAANKPIPEPLIHYVENGRNPDIYTREFVELVRRMNQLARGKAHAFAAFRDVLAREMAAALPEVRDDVRRVLQATGGGGGGGGDGLESLAAASAGAGASSASAPALASASGAAPPGTAAGAADGQQGQGQRS
ncbi:hypothetical protein VTJ83DRAFT_2649 [Remersonia thermophila]|uniref:Mediator of RNA polymerase II transcription subunit 10 n=1 Tax=Remersonia thermophila TaxID=72144 RepID=A0ABR4DJY9_9PEZI